MTFFRLLKCLSPGSRSEIFPEFCPFQPRNVQSVNVVINNMRKKDELGSLFKAKIKALTVFIVFILKYFSCTCESNTFLSVL